MEVALFCIYLFLFGWVIPKINFFKNSHLPPHILVILFLLKVAAGIIYGYVAAKQGPSDTWAFYNESLKETQLLFAEPGRYWVNIFENGYGDGGLFSSTNSYWNNLKGNAFIKLLSVCNAFSFGSYYVNIIFYSFITFFGVVALYKVMRAHLKMPMWLLVASCFLVPSFFYWCSGLHKDGIVFLAVACIIYIVYFGLEDKQLSLRQFIILVVSLCTLFVFKNHIVLVLLPALCAWLLAEKHQNKKMGVFVLVYFLAGLCFFTLKYVHPALNFAEIVAQKRADFMALSGGNTSIPVIAMEPNFFGFIKALPQAASLAALRPYFSDVKNVGILLAFVELIATWLLIIYVVIFCSNKRFTAFGLFVLFFSVTALLMMGYTVNNLGAVLRYRSFLFPIFVPFLCAYLFNKQVNHFKYKK